MDIIVRKAQRSDLDAILNLVRELAIYEKAEDQVTASLEDYRNAFDENIFESDVAEIDGKVVGMSLYYMTYSTWKGKMLYLEDFVVFKAYRNKGVGKLLFEAFLRTAENKKARIVKWQVLDWNEPAIAFYKKYQAIFDKEWWNVKILLDIPEANL